MSSRPSAIRPTRPLAVVGATATGKTDLAVALSEHAPLEVISADSMQVYRGMDLGTAKPTAEQRAAVRHHLIDVVDPAEDYSVVRFQADAAAARDDISQRGVTPTLVGGTGLYVTAVVDDLDIPPQYPDVRADLEAEPDTAALHARLADADPTAAARMEPTNRRRVIRALEVTIGAGRPFSSFGPGVSEHPDTDWVVVGLAVDRSLAAARIEARLRAQIEAGLVDEVAALWDRPEGLGRTARQALGYKEIADHVAGRMTLAEAVDEAIRRTKRFAKRQEAWFRRDPRIAWFSHDGNPLSVVDEVLEHWSRAAAHKSITSTGS